MDRWRALFEAEHARLWRSLLAHTGDPDVASDAAAEAFAQAVRRGEAVRDPAAWVWRAAFRIAAGQLAAGRRSGAGESPDSRAAAADTLPDDVVVLLDALRRLPEADRRVVVLSLVGGLPAADVGRVVGATAGAVRVRLHRARRALMAALAPEPAREEP